MRAPVSLGFRTPETGRMGVRRWVVSAQHGGEYERPDVIPDWDYFTPLGIECVLDVQLGHALADCGLDGGSLLAAILGWHSSWTNMRGGSAPVRLLEGQNTVTLTLPGELLGGRLTLDCRVVLADAGQSSHPLAPHRVGSTLWSESIRIGLEGAGGRFPVLPVDFTVVGIAGGQASGAWALMCDSRDLAASGVGSIRMLLNTAHPAIRTLLETPDVPTALLVQEFLRYDTARQLLTLALTDDELSDGVDYEEDTLGKLLITFVKAMFPARDLETLRGDWRSFPGEFEAEIQARLRFMGRS